MRTHWLVESRRFRITPRYSFTNATASRIAIAGLAAMLSLPTACTRPKEMTPAAVTAPSDETTKMCAALTASGALGARFAGTLPLETGGALFVFGGAEPARVRRVLDGLGLRGARVAGCAADDVVVFVPGIDTDGAPVIEERIRAGAPAARTKEKVLLPPHRAAPPPRATRD